MYSKVFLNTFEARQAATAGTRRTDQVHQQGPGGRVCIKRDWVFRPPLRDPYANMCIQFKGHIHAGGFAVKFPPPSSEPALSGGPGPGGNLNLECVMMMFITAGPSLSTKLCARGDQDSGGRVYSNFFWL